jgi:hypothetical protein
MKAADYWVTVNEDLLKEIEKALEGTYFGNITVGTALAHLKAILEKRQCSPSPVEGVKEATTPTAERGTERLTSIQNHLKEIAEGLELRIDFTDKEYDGDKEAPYDECGLISVLLKGYLNNKK